MRKNVSVRLAAEGGEALSAQMVQIGREGQQALGGIASAARPASSGLTDVSSAATGALARLEEIRASAGRAAAALRANAPAVSDVQDRINRMTGVTPAIGQATSAFIEQGRALDTMRAKYNPVFNVIQRYRGAVSDIRAAHIQGAISADEMTAAIQRERQASLASIAALKGRATAITSVGTASRLTGLRTQQMFYQINDVGVSLIGGMNPFVVLAQQGTQIAQLYSGQGGVGQALKDTRSLAAGAARGVLNLARAHPIATAAIAATALGMAGLTHEINEAQDVQVSLGDTTLAVWQMISDGLWTIVKPAVDMIAPWFSAAWDLVVSGVKTVGNTIINGIRIAVGGVSAVVGTIPDVFLGAFNLALSHVLTKMHDMVWYVSQAVNGVAGLMNDTFGTNFGTTALSGILTTLSDASGTTHENAAAAAERIAGAASEFGERAGEIWNSDPLGEFFDDVKVRAVENALRDTEDAAKKAGAAGKQAGKDISEIGKDKKIDHLKNGVDGLSDALARAAVYGDSLREGLSKVFKGIAFDIVNSGIREALGSIFKVGGDSKGLGGLFGNILSSVFHSGGTVGAGGAMRSVPAAAFVGAERFHGGGWPGLKANEVPVIAERGERILSRQEIARGAGSGGMVEVRLSVDEGGNIVPLVTKIAGNVTARALGAGMAMQDRKLPSAIQNYQARNA